VAPPFREAIFAILYGQGFVDRLPLQS